MRYFCVVMLLASAIGSADVVVADQRQSAAGLRGTKPPEQPLAAIPKEFEFLFHSADQRDREAAKRPTYWDDLWKGLPYDSISLERGGTGGCIVACASSTVTLYRATISGIRESSAPCRTAPCPPGELRGRAELRTVAAPSLALVGLRNAQPPEPRIGEPEVLLPPQPPAPIISDSEGSFRIYEFANLSYLLHKLRFLDLPNEYDCRGCPADRPYVMVSVVAGGKTKTVVDSGLGRPVELWAIQQALDSVSGSIRWTQK